jgi:hypothetical protein
MVRYDDVLDCPVRAGIAAPAARLAWFKFDEGLDSFVDSRLDFDTGGHVAWCAEGDGAGA